jgi:hypothetical protein
LQPAAPSRRGERYRQPQEVLQPHPELPGAAGDPVIGAAAWSATRLIRGMVVRPSQLGQTAVSSRSATGRSSSKVVEQDWQRYS